MKRFKPPIYQPTAGFTLTEGIIVVVIVAILAAISAPAWVAFLNRQRAGAIRSDLVQVIRNTQQDAIQRRQDRSVTIVDDADVPTVTARGFDQPLGSDNNNAGNLALAAYTVTNGTPTDVPGVTFNYQGLVVTPQTLPLIFNIRSENAGIQQCVIVSNLLGNLKTAEGADCNDPAIALELNPAPNPAPDPN
jgi:prepilin-type N-terminal cleavage/methylation domain-containing protein